jgi:DNA mismatch endonuclease (patch repair protein)
MADFLTPKDRSVRMAAIKGKGNQSTEIALAALFKARGITGWRRNTKLFGKPDFVFYGVRLAVFVDGCFWHGCPVHFKKPVENAEFWSAKIARNRTRDRRVSRELKKRGWSVLRVWEHSVKRKGSHARLFMQLNRALLKAAARRHL